MKRSTIGRIVNLGMIAVGVALFVGLLVRMELATIRTQLRDSLWAIVPAFGMYAGNLAASVMGWRETVQPGEHGRRPRFLPLLEAFWAGHAINGLGIAAGGEFTKGYMLSRHVKGEEVAASLVLFGFLNLATNVTATLVGALLCVLWLDLPPAVVWTVCGLASTIALVMLLLRWALSRGLLGGIGRLLHRLPVVRRADVDRLERNAALVDERVRAFRARRPASFRRTIAWCILSRVLRLLQYAALLAGLLPGRSLLFLLLLVLLVQTAVQLVNWSMPFIPGRLGVLEGGSALLFGAAGMGPEVGVSLGILMRLRQALGFGVGLTLAARFQLGSKGARTATPEPSAEASSTEVEP